MRVPFVAALVLSVFAARSARAEQAPAPEATAPATPTSVPSDAADSRTTAQPPAPAAGDAERLGRLLDLAADQGRAGRVKGAIVHSVMIAVETPPGVVLAARSDPGALAIGATLLLRAGLDLIGLAEDAFPGSMEILRDDFRVRASRGQAPAALVEETEHRWIDHIRGARAAATRDAVIDFVLGAGEAALGTYLLLARPGDTISDRREQTAFGAVLVGVGLGGVADGFWNALGTPGVEQWWTVYQRTKQAPGEPRASMALAPTPRGAVTTLRLDF
jgi:hypothetical protein